MFRKLLLFFTAGVIGFQARAGYVPVAVTGYNADVVANGTGTATSSTNNDVDGVDYVFMSLDFNPGTPPTVGLPNNGLINSATTPGLMFQMASLSSNNSLRIASAGATDSLVFTTPQTAGEIYIMATSGSGTASMAVTVNFTDGTNQTFAAATVSDWYGGTNFAISGIGRVTRSTSAIDNNVNDPKLYEFLYAIGSTNYTKLVRSISFLKTGTGILNVMGVTVNTLCTGTPTPGTSVASANVACAASTITLSLSGNSTGVSQMYQWQSSSTLTGTYTNIGTASSTSTTTTTITATTYFRAALTCGSNTSYSTPVQVNFITTLPAGTYTINSGAAASATNFQSFTGAVTALGCGIAGPVTFNVVAGAPAYNEQISIPSIPGASGTNTVTFNGNGNTLTYNATSSSAPHTLVLNGADYIRFNNLNIIGTGGTYALVCHLWNQADSNSFTNCTFTAPANCTNTTQIPFSISGSATGGTTSGTAGNYNTITGCTINSGYYNTTIYGSTANNAIGNRVINCNLKDFYFYGAYTAYSNGTLFSGNNIERPTRTTLSTYYGVYLTTGSINTTVEKNRLHDPFGAAPTNTGTVYAIYQLASATAGNENNIVNNLLYNMNSSGSLYLIYLSTYNYTNVYHNTIVADYAASTAGLVYGIYSAGTAGITIKNNLVYITRGGSGTKYCLYYSGTKISNNNDLYINSPAGTNAVGYYSTAFTTLANWQTANSAAWDQQSVSIDPSFTSPSTGDFKPTAMALNDLGTAAGVSTDILGVTRPATTPDIGAYEFGSNCAPVTGLAASAITSTSATLAWTAVSGATGYEYVLDQLSTNPTGAGTAITATTYNATPLLPFTTYYMHVRTNCGTGFSVWTTISFTTLCAPPTATITPAGATTFCTPGSVVLNANTGTGLTYQWKRGGIDITGATSSSYTATTSGNYTVVTSISTCNTTSAIVAVTVSTRPDTTVTMSPASGMVCTGSTLTLSVPSVTSLTYQWFQGSTAISGATSNTYTASTSGNYRVYVANASCGDTSSVRAVTVLPKPVSTITSAGATAICAGGSVVLSGPAPATGITYQWLLNNTGIPGATSDTYAATTAGSYRLVLSNGTCTDTSAAITTTVNPLPTATATPAGPTAFCTGGSVTLNANTGTGITYKWLRNNTVIAGATAGAYTATTTGNYAVIVTNTATGCADTSRPAIAVTVSAIPANTLSFTGTLTFCQGGNVRFQAATGTGYTYVWYKDSGIIPGATTSAYTATAAGVYYVVITNGPCTTTTITRTVVVNPLPTATATPAGPTAFCTGGSVIINANTGTGLTYQWRNGTGNIPGATSPAYTASASGTYTVVVSDGTCSNTSGTVVVNVSTMPIAVITPTGTPAFCQGGSVTLNANTGAGYTYQWLLNGSPVPGAVAAVYSASATGSYTVAITNGTCKDTSAPLVVSVTPAPPAIITPAGPTTFCQGGSVVLNANKATGYTYQWTKNTFNIPGATSWQYTAVASGDYAVHIFDGTCPATSTDVTVTVNNFPVAVITLTNGVDMSTGTFSSYQWYRNGVLIPGATAQNYSATRDGYYTVVVADAIGCSATSAVQRITALDIENTGKNIIPVKIWPNPAAAVLHIDADQAVDVTIGTIDGKELMKVENARTVDIAHLPQGLYLIRVADHRSGALIKVDKINKL